MSDRLIILDRSFGEGLLTRVMKAEAKAHAAFSKARAEQEKLVQAQPEYGNPLCVLGLIDAALGNKEAALEEGRRAIELLPVEKDSVNGSLMILYFAVTAAWTGEKDLALQQLELGARAPVASQMVTYGALKLLPFWGPLRGDPRFEKIVASLALRSILPCLVNDHLCHVERSRDISNYLPLVRVRDSSTSLGMTNNC